MENCRQIMQSGLNELQISFDSAQVDALLAFVLLIQKWNKAYNLTAVRDREDMVRLHILDSLTVLPYLKDRSVADIGTGAGLPGIPLAIFRPDIAFTLVDANSKKTRFVQQAVLELKLKNVTVVHARVESFQPNKLFSTVLMRAFSSLPDIMSLTRHLLLQDGILLAMKGHQPEQELASILESYSIKPVKVPGVAAERCLVQIEGVAQNHG